MQYLCHSVSTERRRTRSIRGREGSLKKKRAYFLSFRRHRETGIRDQLQLSTNGRLKTLERGRETKSNRSNGPSSSIWGVAPFLPVTLLPLFLSSTRNDRKGRHFNPGSSEEIWLPNHYGGHTNFHSEVVASSPPVSGRGILQRGRLIFDRKTASLRTSFCSSHSTMFPIHSFT